MASVTASGTAKQQQGAGAEAQPPAQQKKDPHYLQQRWLAAAKNKALAITLTNGAELRGTLIGNDQFTLWLKEDNGQIALVYKGACAVLRRAGEGENGQPG